LREEAVDIYHRAERNLAVARATTQWEKLPYPVVKNPQASMLTDVGVQKERVKFGNDYLVILEGGEDNQAALAIEMGHAPSGYFKGSATKSPRGLYILMRAAGAALMSTKGWRRGRR
jgi:hypothetical protein